MMTRKWANLLGAILVLPLSLWLVSQAIGYGPGFDRPALPVGAKAKGPSTKGTLSYTLVENNTKLLASFSGKCGGDEKIEVNISNLDVTSFSNLAAFQADGYKQVEAFVEGFFLDAIAFGGISGAFGPCYPNISPFLGVVISSTKTVAKTSSLWVADATVHVVYVEN